MKRVVVLISGQGRNLQALIDAERRGVLGATLVAVISNRSDAVGLDRARAANIPTQVVVHSAYADRDAFDAALVAAIDAHTPDLIVMAGFMRIVGADFIRRYRGRMLNIHPSLLPKYPGLKTHQRALDAGDVEHGATVHFVTDDLDGGPLILQGRLPIRPCDDATTLAERVMNEIEVKIYPQAVAWLAQGKISIDACTQPPQSLSDLEPEFRGCAQDGCSGLS